MVYINILKCSLLEVCEYAIKRYQKSLHQLNKGGLLDSFTCTSTLGHALLPNMGEPMETELAQILCTARLTGPEWSALSVSVEGSRHLENQSTGKENNHPI